MRRAFSAASLLRVAHVCLAAGVLLTAGLEAVHAAARFDAYGAWASGTLPTGTALRVTAQGDWLQLFNATPFLLVLGLLLLATPAAAGLYDAATRRRITGALAVLFLGFLASAAFRAVAEPGSVLATWTRMNVVGALAAAGAVTLLAWPSARARLFAVAGGVLLSFRGIALEHADALYVRATADATLWSAALAWRGVPMILGAAGLLAFTVALVLATRPAAPATLPSDAPTPAGVEAGR